MQVSLKDRSFCSVNLSVSLGQKCLSVCAFITHTSTNSTVHLLYISLFLIIWLVGYCIYLDLFIIH